MATLNASQLFNVEGMVFVVTGGGSGLGAMMTNALHANGAAKVYILGRRLEKLEEVARKSDDGRIVPIKCDVTSKEDLAAAAEKVKSEVGFVNAVIANSGISGPLLNGLPEKPSVDELQSFLWKVPMEEITNTFAVNFTAVFYTLLAFLPLLDAGNKATDSPATKTGVKSQFAVTGSIAAFNRTPTAGFSYGTSKIAIVHLMKQMATYLVPYHIRTNVIAPGLYPSEMTEGLLSHTKFTTEEGSVPQHVAPATRLGSEEDMAGCILYLCSRAGAYLNGNIVITDGGRLSVMPATY